VTVNIAAQWKRDNRELNGLSAIEDDLLGKPHEPRYAVVKIETKRITRDLADGDVEVPTVNIVHIEPVDEADEETVKKLLTDRYSARTGKPEPQPTLFDSAADSAADGPVSEREPDEWLDDATSAKG